MKMVVDKEYCLGKDPDLQGVAAREEVFVLDCFQVGFRHLVFCGLGMLGSTGVGFGG